MRKPGRQQGIPRYRRDGQTALKLPGTLDERYSLGRDLDDFTEGVDYIGTCQSCGSYWDVRHYKTCPATRPDGGRCDGYIG